MEEKTLELMKKFEQDYEVYVSATDALTYWVIYARVPRGPTDETHHLHNGVKYVTGPNEGGNVLVMREPSVSDTYSAESWGPMETIDDFVKKALAQILVDKAAWERRPEGECGASCS